MAGPGVAGAKPGTGQEAGAAALRLVGPGERSQEPSRPEPGGRRASSVLLLVCLALLSAVVFGLVMINIALAQSSIEFNKVQKEVAQEQDLQRRLRFDVARAESPERIARMAVDLGMVPPEREEYLQGPPGPASEVDRRRPTPGAADGFELSAALP
ncbi:MAG: hypothetical protein ACT4OM_00145 [Actinomycetota bacterium]